MSTLAQLQRELHEPWTPEYKAKQIHEVPRGRIVNREEYILKQCAGKQVAHFGSASGELHDALRVVATKVIGIDKDAGPCTDYQIDLDDLEKEIPSPVRRMDLALLGEILEHLSNPGFLLQRLVGMRLLVTAPNAFCNGAQFYMKRGIENVNRDHVCWYSYTTLKTLLSRYDFRVIDHAWYKGTAGAERASEGLIFLAK